MAEPFRVLIVASPSENVELIVETLQEAGVGLDHLIVEIEENPDASSRPNVDLVLVDADQRSLGAAAAEAFKRTGLDIPLVVIGDEETDQAAAEWLALGAGDYLIRRHPWRLKQVVARAQVDKRLALEHTRTQEDLRLRNQELKTLVDVASILGPAQELRGPEQGGPGGGAAYLRRRLGNSKGGRPRPGHAFDSQGRRRETGTAKRPAFGRGAFGGGFPTG